MLSRRWQHRSSHARAHLHVLAASAAELQPQWMQLGTPARWWLHATCWLRRTVLPLQRMKPASPGMPLLLSARWMRRALLNMRKSGFSLR